MSLYVPLAEAVAIHDGSQMKPTLQVKKTSTSNTITYPDENFPKHFILNTKWARHAIPDAVAAEQANANLNTFKVSYHNGSSKSYPWATFTITLASGLRYVPGNQIQPAGTYLYQYTSPDGIQSLTLFFPTGLQTGAQGSFAFETVYHAPKG